MGKAVYHVIGLLPEGRSWVLNLDPRTLEDAKRAIYWQRVGEPASEWVITQYEPSQGFVDVDGNSYIPDKGPYTAEAWQAFWAHYGD